MTALTAPQLLKMEDGEFDAKIKEMSVKNLINTITLVQKEMSREQENFNSLTSELLSVKKNSGQYKSISKEMTVSQTRLTLLMNRSMKCFSQQGKQQNKAATDKKNSFQEAQTKGNAESRKSEPVKPTIVTQKPLESKDQFKRHSDIVQSSSNILVQSLKSSSPVMKLKTTNNVNGSGGVNGAPGVPVVRSSSPMSQRITSDITSKSQVRSNNLDKVKAHLNVKNENDSLKVAVQPKTESLSNSGATLGPMAEQRNKYMSKSSDNVFKKTTPHKTEIVKGITSTKPRSTVVMNADKQMMDLDMFTERKTMMDELKKFDQTLKPRTARTHSDKVTEVKLNLAKSGDTRSSANIEPKLSSTSVEHKGNVLGDIKLGKRPSELKQTKTVNFRTEQNVNERNDNEMKVPQVVKSTKETVAPKVPENHSQSKLFDDLLYCVESDKSDQSSENSPREATTDAVLEQKQKIENTISQILETSTVAKLGTVNDDIPVTGEITLEVTRDSTHATEASDDSLSQSSGTSEEDDTFVTEFHFTGSPLKTPVAEAAIPKKREALKQSHDVSHAGQRSAKVVAPSSSSHSNNAHNNAADICTTAQTSSQIASGINGNKSDINAKGQSPPKTESVSGILGNEADNSDEELVVDTRVKFREWDPSKLLAKLYEVNMMPDNVEDISHKFIGMEGLMEKLPMNKKKATLLKTWKRRFFRAKDGWLHYYESGNTNNPSDSLQLMGGKVEELGPRVLGVDDGRGKYLMVRVPTDHEYGLWKVALESQTADNVKATYVRPAPASIPNPKKKVVIIDIGSSGIRAGILGERATLPQVFFPCIVAIHKETREIVVGADALKPDVRRVSNIMQPIEPTNKVDKFNIDMSVMTEVLKKVFKDLRVNQAQYLVMLSTPQNLGDRLREGLMRILVDELHVRGVCMVQQALLALYSYNSMSGIIVDIGERLEILPIYDGLLIEGGVSRQAYGGTKIQDSMYISLLENRYQFLSPIEKLLVRYICEQTCYVTDNYAERKEICDADPSSYSSVVHLTEFDLPKGAHETVKVDHSCFKSPEGFFNTAMWEMDYKNIQKQIYSAIQQCPMDARKQMYRSVCLSGGVTTIPGFAERLQDELRKLAPPAAIVEVHASPQRYHAAYIGACSVAAMDVFEMSCVTADEWHKMGVKACRKWGTG